MGIIKYVIGRTLEGFENGSGSCDFLQNDLGSHERWFDSEDEAKDYIEHNIDDKDHEFFVMESEHPEGYEEYWETKDKDYKEQVKRNGFWL